MLKLLTPLKHRSAPSVAVVIVSLALYACGQKGMLYHPTPSTNTEPDHQYEDSSKKTDVISPNTH